MNPFVAYDNIVPLLAPADITNSATVSSYLDLKGANRAALLLVFGNIHSGTGTDTEVITIEGATAEGGSEAAIAFNYRKSGALGANTWGAITASASTGLALAITEDNILLWVEIDPAVMAANDYRYVRAKLTATPDMANCVVGVLGLVDPIYKQTTFISVTASASA